MAIDAAVEKQIRDLVEKHTVVLFMKGNRSFPQCGFSAAVVSILKDVGVPFETANVLSDPQLREGVKTFSDWPTIPQLYVNGEFVGGCDIIREMHASGELQKLLGVETKAPKLPAIELSDAAAKAFLDATDPPAEGSPPETHEHLRLEIDGRFAVDLFFGPRKQGDLEVTTKGVLILIDPASAKRADGVAIDYVDGPSGPGFKIDNPNAPAAVKQISPKDLVALMAENKAVKLFDVRTDKERQTASIEGSIFLDESGKAELGKLDKSNPVVFQCHHGGRSQAAADHYLSQGFKNVYNLAGGIEAWSREVDPKVPRY